MATANMNLELPTVSITAGPTWAEDLNAAFDLVDVHDHSSGKGVKITPAGIDINANLDVQNYIFYNFKASRYEEQSATLTGASYVNSIYSVLGNLYFTNGAGTAIQITSGSSIAAVAGSAVSVESLLVTNSLTISSSDTFSHLRINTSAARTITLPSASAVAAGRFYILKDITGQANTNNISIAPNGADTIDGDSSYTIDSDFASLILVSDGVSAWSVA